MSGVYLAGTGINVTRPSRALDGLVAFIPADGILVGMLSLGGVGACGSCCPRNLQYTHRAFS